MELEHLESQALTNQDAQLLVTEAKQQVAAFRKSLAELHAGQGHIALGYVSWEAFVKSEFGRSLSWFYRQVKAWEVQENLQAVCSEPIQLSERALRELGKVEAGVQQVVYKAAQEASGGKITEAAIKHAADAIQETYVTGVYSDAEGNQITAQDIITGDTAGRMVEAKQRSLERLNGNKQYLVQNRSARVGDLFQAGGVINLLLELPVMAECDLMQSCGQDVQISVWVKTDG